MYDPQFWIDSDVYPLLVKWGLSTGYDINTNEPHTILYNIVCYDGIRTRELKAEGNETSLSREEAETLVNDLLPYIGNREKLYGPGYDPPIRLHEDFSVHKFLPVIQGVHEVAWEQCGIYHQINKLLFMGELMDRNDVIALIRCLEYNTVMSPFVVTYNLLKTRGGMAIMWAKQEMATLSAARSVLRKEKGRHVTADWRIYQDVTPTARKEESLPDAYVPCEGWLWLRVYHKKDGAMCPDYWEEGIYEDLGELKNDLIEIQDSDMYAIWAIYACVYHEPVSEPEPGILEWEVENADWEA